MSDSTACECGHSIEDHDRKTHACDECDCIYFESADDETEETQP